MKHSLLYILTLSALLLVACTSNEEERASQTTVLSIPFAVCEAPDDTDSYLATKGTGDPGVMENLPAPKYLYVWVDYVNSSGTRGLYHYTESGIESKWSKRTDNPERWLHRSKFTIPGVELLDGSTLQVYAIASQHSMTIPDYGNITALQGAELGLSSWQVEATSTHNTAAAAHSYALGNLYSTPLALMGSGNDDATAAGISGDLLNNGTYRVIVSGTTAQLSEVHPTRLYHCAAKADFKWEVATALQPGVSVSTITVTGLPTTLKVFEPTKNPTNSTADCNLLASSGAVNPLNEGNKWLGREYAYVLQPPTTTSTGDGILRYNATFTGRTPDSKNTLNNQPTSPATNPVFTTWYRINADIK